MKRLQLLIIGLLFSISSIYAEIIGEIKVDTLKWAAVAYLSIIPDFSQTTTISYNNVIDRVPITKNGKFIFSTNFLADELHLYRIHVSKKGDPAASLIIGGAEHNHVFLFAKRYSKIVLKCESPNGIFNGGLSYSDKLNKSLLFINQLKNRVDSLDFYGTTIDKEFYRNDIYNQLRLYADTCQTPLVSLFALYQSNYREDFLIHPGYYVSYLKKWSSENSNYFLVIRKQLNIEKESDSKILVITLLISLLIFISIVMNLKSRKLKNSNPKQELTPQERRVFTLLHEGKSNKDIAEILSISLSTVKSHINNIYSKLNISSRKELMNLNGS